MSGNHAHALYYHGHSAVHRLAPETKLVAQVLFVLVVVATPREAFWAFGVYAGMVLAAAGAAAIPIGFLLRRLAIEVPFVAFAFFLPIVGQGERVDVLGVSLSVEGLWGAWNILAKATIGVMASTLLASTTTMAEFLTGFDRLHVPRAFTSIASFMVRYMDVIADDVRRMRIARLSRGYEGRWIWQARAIGQTAGALFIRAYERGERVYLAMLSRGYAGTMPEMGEVRATPRQWLTALAPVSVALPVCVFAWMQRP
ncbi:MAG TPA: cobalt ECF transporter T component CbiQ [Actinomycetota bacterium]|nr:cobalt ECF transporter T component CbiQ [Actinomycetota bacterium]